MVGSNVRIGALLGAAMRIGELVIRLKRTASGKQTTKTTVTILYSVLEIRYHKTQAFGVSRCSAWEVSV